MHVATKWLDVCKMSDLVPGSGVCALVGGKQVALFYQPKSEPAVFAVDNFDPIGKAQVLYRGIVGSLQNRQVVASPLYKQHFCLQTGECLEQPEVQLTVYPVKTSGDNVQVGIETTL